MEIIEFIDGLLVSKCGRVFREVSYTSRGNSKIKYRAFNYKGLRYDVHRTVAKAFIPNPRNVNCVLHTDDNPQNNHVTNLSWGTHAENMRQIVSKGRNPLSKNQKAILVAHRQGMRARDIAKFLGVTESRISQILSSLRKRGFIP